MVSALLCVTARQLKNKTGQTLRRVRNGEKLAITNRGTPIALILPFAAEKSGEAPTIRPFEEAWPDISRALTLRGGRGRSWRVQLARSRRRG